jgi:hypothetical protein
MWVQDAMVLAASWPRCSDLLGHFLEEPCGPRRTAAGCPSTVRPTYGPEGSVQQRSTATSALSNTFSLIQMPLANVNKSYKRRLRGVRDEEVELRGAHVHPGLRAVAARWFAR